MESRVNSDKAQMESSRSGDARRDSSRVATLAKRGLRFKATTVAIASVVLALTVMATASLIQGHRAMIAHEEEATDAIASAFGSVIAPHLADRNLAALTRDADSFLGGSAHIRFVAIYSSDDTLLVYRDRSGMPSAPSTASAASETIVRQMPATMTRDGVNRAVGRIVLGVAAGPRFASMREQSVMTLIMVVIGATLSISLIHVTIRRWAHRLDQLVEVTMGMSRGEYGRALHDEHQDEIGELARAFERMRIAVQERTSELRNLNETLAEQVKERTRDLEESMQAAEHARELAEQASRAKSAFLANMSHELRTPLNGVVGMIELLRETSLDEQQRRYVTICRSSADSLLSLITDILDFSKIEAGRVELESITFNLRSVTEDVAAMLAQNADRRGLELACYVDPELPEAVSGDRDRLRQVLINIVNNAIKFTEKGEVVIRALPRERDGEYQMIHFSVTDTGIGIPRDRMDRLFKSFSQVDSSTTRKYGGTGLGLAISKRLVHMMGGEIGCESTVGKGSTFWFTVRLRVEEDVEVKRPQPSVDVQGLRALIVDDNGTNRLILSTQLTTWGLDVATAENGDQALLLLRRASRAGKPFKIALLDMAMPHMDGLELAQTIHGAPELQPIAMIMLTSFDEVIDPATRERVGIFSCLQKPSRQADLLEAISEAVASTSEDAAAPSSEEAPERAEPKPMAKDRPRAAAEQHRSLTVAAPKLRILIAEDNEANRMVTSEIIRLAGYEFDMVGTGAEAVKAVQNERYGLILMDCQMPEMDGFEATQQIRELEEKGALPSANDADRLPIIALTANAIKGDRERCLEAGMDDYVSKPVEPKTLVQVIERHLIAAPVRKEPPKPPDTKHAAQVVAPKQAPTAHPRAGSPIDAESLLARCVNNVQFLNSVLDKFETEAASYLKQLDSHIEENNADSSARTAHLIAGLAAVLSAADLRAAASQMEEIARQNRIEELAALRDAVRAETQRCFEFIPELRERLASKSPSTTGGRARS